jgi:diguanylate cyclase (GGDEF)-like protein
MWCAGQIGGQHTCVGAANRSKQNEAPLARANGPPPLKGLMTIFTSSIRARMTLFIVAFLAIVVGLAVSGELVLKSAGLKSEEIDQKWLAGMAILAEIGDRVAEYRIAEGYRVLASEPKARAEAELLADEDRRVIQDLQTTYASLLGKDARIADLVSFQTAWTAYYTQHDAWARDGKDDTADDAALYNGILQQLYKATDAAFDRLIAANLSAAHAQVGAIQHLTSVSINVGIVVSAGATLLALWLLVRIRTQITRPLEAITRALSKLAAGSREIRVPELHRGDEIGAMAKAFEIFRTNALALEQAHKATRVAQEQAQTLARHDALTGLPNRRVFSAELEAVLGNAQSGAAPYSVLLVGLDQFKQVNDLHGHAVGDLVLCEIARRLEALVRSTGGVARLGGDEFAIFAKAAAGHETPLDEARHLAMRVLGAIRAPILVDGKRIEIGASIGIAPCGTDSAGAGHLLHSADIAMYRVKRDARGTFQFFEQSMEDDLRAQGALETDLKRAVAEGKIEPHYQPLVELRNNRICGFEALARWAHPERGFVPPDLFIPLIEQFGLMSEFTSSILRQACRDAKNWPDNVRLSVNISPSELKDLLLPSRILAILSIEAFPPARLELEITETALLSNIETAKSILTTLQSSGITVSLDDFGTGYASLSHLRELKFDKVKIDRSYVHSMQTNPESEKIVDAILGLTKNLNLQAVAEGIEDSATLLCLAAKGCEFGQGYYFGKATNAAGARDVLMERTNIQKRITEAQAAA